MKIEHKKLSEKIHLLIFDTQYDITSTFLRFQEYYESPRFSGKFFHLEEYKSWYVDESPMANKEGKFTYHEDWSGFNIPSTILKPFYEGQFDPLSGSEQNLLNLFKNEKELFYIIGVNKENGDIKKSIDHEVAHALFFLNPQYKEDVLSVIRKYDTAKLREELSSTGGYHNSVLDDEVQAYGINGSRALKITLPESMMMELNQIFKRYTKNILL